MQASAFVVLLTLASLARAQTPLPSETDRQAEIDAVWKGAQGLAVHGPAPITLRDQAILHLPAGESFIPEPQTARLLAAHGGTPGTSLVGMIVGDGDTDGWGIIVRFIKDGYIKDDDAKDWNADDLLKNLRDGTSRANIERAKKGFPELDVIGWVEPPAYDAASHRLVWSLSVQPHDAPADRPHTINYNTYALGRDGYFSLNLLSNTRQIEADKPIAHGLLAALDYNEGKRYEDFVGSTDKVAAYGLAALIGVVAVKKIGLLAGIGIFFLKIWKVGLLVIAGVGAAIRRFFKRTPPAGE